VLAREEGICDSVLIGNLVFEEIHRFEPGLPIKLIDKFLAVVFFEFESFERDDL